MEERNSRRITNDADVVRSLTTRFRFSEYGFFGSVGIAVAAVIFLIGAYVPNYWQGSVEFFYHFRSWYWEMPKPNYAVVVTIVVAIGLYVGFNLTATPPPTSLRAIFDECSEELLGITPSKEDYQLIGHLSDQMDIQ